MINQLIKIILIIIALMYIHTFLIFGYRGNKGRSGVNFGDIVNSLTSKDPVCARLWAISLM